MKRSIFLTSLFVSCECCKLYLIPSTVPGSGRGVVAGTSIGLGSKIESSLSLIIKDETVRDSQLTNYAYESNDEDYNVLMFGLASLYNHHTVNKTIEYYWSEEPVDDPTKLMQHYTSYTLSNFSAIANISVGEEIMSHYGSEWFDRFDDIQPSNDPKVIEPEDLRVHGHCLTDVFIGPSTLPGDVGNGLFAARAFEEGEVVTVSPGQQRAGELLLRGGGLGHGAVPTQLRPDDQPCSLPQRFPRCCFIILRKRGGGLVRLE
jgi:hypothetical protein